MKFVRNSCNLVSYEIRTNLVQISYEFRVNFVAIDSEVPIRTKVSYSEFIRISYEFHGI